MKPEAAINQKIMERIEDGFQTADQVLYCGECKEHGKLTPVFELTIEEVKVRMEELAAKGQIERRPQGKATDSPGNPIYIYVPAGTGAYSPNRPRGDEMISGKGER